MTPCGSEGAKRTGRGVERDGEDDSEVERPRRVQGSESDTNQAHLSFLSVFSIHYILGGTRSFFFFQLKSCKTEGGKPTREKENKREVCPPARHPVAHTDSIKMMCSQSEWPGRQTHARMMPVPQRH
jgi:hypothetical protein